MYNKPRDLIAYLSTLDPEQPLIWSVFTFEDTMPRIIDNMDYPETADMANWADENKDDLWKSCVTSYPVERELEWLFEGVDHYLWEHIESEFKKNLLNKEAN